MGVCRHPEVGDVWVRGRIFCAVVEVERGWLMPCDQADERGLGHTRTRLERLNKY